MESANHPRRRRVEVKFRFQSVLYPHDHIYLNDRNQKPIKQADYLKSEKTPDGKPLRP